MEKAITALIKELKTSNNNDDTSSQNLPLDNLIRNDKDYNKMKIIHIGLRNW